MGKPRQRVAAVLIAGLLLTASPAHAQWTTDVTGMAIVGVETSIVGTLTAFGTWLETIFLTQVESAISANTSANSTAHNVSTEAERQLTDLKLAQEWTLAKASTQGQAALQTQPSVTACQPASGSRAVVSNELPDSMNTSLMLDAGMRRMSNAPGENTQNGTFAGLSLDYQYRMANYQNCQETQPGNASCVNGAMPDADISAMTLFGQDTFRKQPPVGQTTPTYTAQQWETAAQDFCMNATDTADPNPLRNDALISPQGIPAHMLRKAADSRMALSQMICFEMVAERTPNQAVTCAAGATPVAAGGPCWGQKIMNDLIATYPGDTSLANQAQGPYSTYQMLKILASDQFADPAWDNMISQESGETQLLQVLNGLQAASLQMQWKEYEMLERLKLVDAVSLAMSVEKSRHDSPAVQSTH